MVKLGIWEERNIFLLHIAEYIKKYGGEYVRPAKNGLNDSKGITLTLEQWRKLYENIEFIQ